MSAAEKKTVFRIATVLGTMRQQKWDAKASIFRPTFDDLMSPN